MSTVTNNQMIFALISGGDVQVHQMIEPNHGKEILNRQGT